MGYLLNFVGFVIGGLLSFLIICMIVNAVLSWLVAFDVIRLNSPFAHSVASFLDAITRPIVAPIQRIMPKLGGVDLSYLVAILILEGVQRFLLPGALGALAKLLGA